MRSALRLWIVPILGGVVPTSVIYAVMAYRWNSVEHACTLELRVDRFGRPIGGGGCSLDFPSFTLMAVLLAVGLVGFFLTLRLVRRQSNRGA